MIRPLRRAHFWTWVSLAALLPVLLALGLASRRTSTPPNSGSSWKSYR